MSETSAGFAVSLTVSLIGMYFTLLVVPRFARVMSSGKPVNNRQDFVRIRLAHLTDVVTNFSAALTTLLAYLLAGLVPSYYSWVAVVVATTLVFSAIAMSSPRVSGAYMRLSYHGITVASALVLSANFLGIVLSSFH